MGVENDVGIEYVGCDRDKSKEERRKHTRIEEYQNQGVPRAFERGF
jgi:hypothetical protein